MPPKKSTTTKPPANKIINFYESKEVQKFMPKSHNPNYDSHHIKTPFRGILLGSSGAGKTNLLFNIFNQFSETFNHIYIYTQAEEPLYDYLQSQLPKDALTIKYGLQPCRDFDEKNYYGASLVVFDDCCNEKDQKCILDLFIRGRKIASGVSLLYLTQSYFKVPKTVRLQSQYIFILKVGNLRDLKLMLSDYSLNTTKEEMVQMYDYCCNQPNEFGSFMLIDLVAPQTKTFRKNFDEYLT